MNNKRLYKSEANCMVCGVCGGIAEYLAVDPTVIRLLWVLLTCISAGIGGVAAYIVAAVIMPG